MLITVQISRCSFRLLKKSMEPMKSHQIPGNDSIRNLQLLKKVLMMILKWSRIISIASSEALLQKICTTKAIMNRNQSDRVVSLINMATR